MYIWNKVLVGLIFVATIPFIIFAAQALKTHAYWRKAYNAHEERLATLTRQNEELLNGTTGAEDGVRRLKLELHKVMMDRGRVWFDCVVQRVDPQTGAMVVGTRAPNPNGIAKQSVLYAISQIPVQQQQQKEGLLGYLGEFQATEVAPNAVTLVPAMKLGPREIRRLQAMVQKPVSLYDILPYDNHEAFANLSDDEIKGLLRYASPETVRQYQKDGKKAEAGDPENVEIEGVVTRRRRDDAGNYLRQLNDYEILFQSQHAQLSLIKAHREALTRDIQYLAAASADAELQKKFREEEKKELKAKQEQAERELAVVKTHEERLEKKLAEIKEQIKQTLASNTKTAGELARVQEEAAELIERRVQSIAKGDAAR